MLDPQLSATTQTLFLSKNINFRPHWGKYMPTNDWEVVDKKTYLERAYPKWTDWKNLRAKNDPGKIFVTDYWSARLPPLD